jgi:hypothetical protein
LRRRPIAIAVVVLLVLIASGWSVRQFWTGPDGYANFRPVLASELMPRAEAHLYFPNSQRLAVETHDMVPPFIASAGAPAFIGTTLAADAPADEIRSWYQTALQNIGWAFHRIPTSPHIDYWYRGSREEFHLYFLNPGDYGYIQTDRSTEYVAVYMVLNYTPSSR